MSFTLIIVIIQTILISTLLIKGGVIKQTTDNAYALFHDKVNSRLGVIESEMSNSWTVFDPYLNNLSNLFEVNEDDGDFLREGSNELIELLRRTQATGAFIILTDGKKPKAQEYLPALYIRDYDPAMNSYSDDDLYMVYGPSDIGSDYWIPLDQTWQYSFMPTEDNIHFIEKTLSDEIVSAHSSNVGYWNTPFRLSPNDIEIITYSMPLYDRFGNLKGIIGIEISLNYLANFLPNNELYPQDSLGYIVAYKDGNSNNLEPIVSSGALQSRLLNLDESFNMTLVDEDKQIYQLNNNNASEDIYAAIEKFGLYNYNSPFDDENWYLIGMMREEHLLKSTYVVKNIVLYSIGLALLLGVAGGIIISLQMSKPIVRLSRQLRLTEGDQNMKLLKTGLTEVDTLSDAFMTTNQAMINAASRFDKMLQMSNLPIAAYEINEKRNTFFVTDRFFELIGYSKENNEADLERQISYDTFLKLLETHFSTPLPEEKDIFEIKSAQTRYIQYNQSIHGNVRIGVILDVTEKINEKRKIRWERDHDYLTGVLTSDGFIAAYDRWANQPLGGFAALGMFDLDNLKTVNDTYGHKWGDIYIQRAADMLLNMASDKHIVVGRRSGDEFYVLFHDYDSQETIIQIIEQFYVSLNNSPIAFPDGLQKNVGISTGIKWVFNNQDNFDTLLHAADQALYEAKSGQKGTYKIYDAM